MTDPTRVKESLAEQATAGNPSLVVGDGVAASALPCTASLVTNAAKKNKNKAKRSADTNLAWFFRALFLALVACTFVMSAQNTYGEVTAQFWKNFPLQIFWTACLFRINDAAGKRYGTQPPLPFALLMAISVVSFVCMPIPSPYHFFARWMDPFFLLWVVSQLAFFVGIGAFIEKKEQPDKPVWKFPLMLSVCSNFYLLPSLVAPALIDTSLGFNAGWSLCQLFGLAFLINRLAPPKEKKVAETVYPIEEDGATIIRYRPFAAIERWWRQRFAGSTIKVESARRGLIRWFAAPISIFTMVALMPLAGTAGLMQLSESAKTASANTATQETHVKPAASADPKSAQQNLSLMLTILAGFSGTIAAGLLYYWSKPGYLALAKDGMRLGWRNGFTRRQGSLVPWSDIVYIDLVGGADNAANKTLQFRRQSGQAFELKLSSIETVAEKEAILTALKKWAPLVERDAQVIEYLQPPADHSYTELWLQALTAPPQRERLQPLVGGATLQDKKYKVVNSLGVGGQGQAYLATTEKNETVVLKEFILPVYVDVEVRKGALEQFQNEAQILRHLDHPNIVKLNDFFIEDHRAYLVLEHIDGASLRQIVDKRGKLPESEVRKLAQQMCDMLAYLHGLSPPVVHRDFTPDNLILGKDGKLKLIDFNVAKQIVESTAVGTVVGKHAYLPPEQFRGQPVPQSDIYAMGCTLQYLISGTDPEPVSMSSPKQREPEVTDSFDELVRKATALDVQLRYQDVRDLAKDLT